MADETRQELEQGSGVGEQAVTGQQPEGAQQAAVTEPAPTAETREPIAEAGTEPQERVDLTELEEFRKWQARMDQRQAQLHRQLEEQQQRLRERERQLEELREQQILSEADPDEVIAFYQGQAAQTKRELEQQQRAMREQQEVQARAQSLLGELGLDPEAPGLDWGDGVPSWDNYRRLAESAAKLVAQRNRQAAETAQEKAERAAREARQAAIAETGAARTTTATGSGPTPSLRQQYEADLAKLKRTGRVTDYVELRAAYRAKGLDV